MEVGRELALAVFLAPASTLAQPLQAVLVLLDLLCELVPKVDLFIDPLENRVDVELTDLDLLREVICAVADARLPFLALQAGVGGVLFGLLVELPAQFLAILEQAIAHRLLSVQAVA